MAGEPDVADLALLLCSQYGFVRSAFCEVAVRVFEPDILMQLDQIDVVGLQALQRFINLLRRLLCTTVVLRHQENLLAITIPQCLTHPPFAFSAVVIPAVIHKRNAMIDGEANDANALLRVRLEPDVKAAQA
jgi:hypothetical protein